MMKTYICPDLVLVLLSDSDVIATSGGDNYCLDNFPVLSDPALE